MLKLRRRKKRTLLKSEEEYLVNGYFIAKIGGDTAENGPSRKSGVCLGIRLRQSDPSKVKILHYIADIFSSKDTCTFTLILQRAKVSKYHQSIKIRFSTQNIKISAVSTPNFARISPFFCICRDLPEYIGENAPICQRMQKSFAPNFGNFQKISKTLSYFDTLAVFYTLVLCWIFAFSF